MLGQYSKFVRPGYSRIDATHLPQTGVSVSAYQDTGTESLVIIATNYTGSAVSQTFNLTNAPKLSTLTPTITSASLNLAERSNVSVSGNSFTYTLPAESITTFVGSASIPPTNEPHLDGGALGSQSQVVAWFLLSIIVKLVGIF
jgi:glucuronoarabinoxylan endo-1,4-beta-xylanase